MDKISFEINDDLNVAGTSKRGTITTTFKKLVSVFGPPTNRMGDNSFNEWRMQLRVPDDEDPQEFDYVIATIYDWGEETDPARYPTREYTFTIGSKNIDGAYYIHQILNDNT